MEKEAYKLMKRDFIPIIGYFIYVGRNRDSLIENSEYSKKDYKTVIRGRLFSLYIL